MGHIKKYKGIMHKCTLVARQRGSLFIFDIVHLPTDLIPAPNYDIFLNKKKALSAPAPDC
jgi:hypothetical protein